MTIKFEGLTMNQLAERNAELIAEMEQARVAIGSLGWMTLGEAITLTISEKNKQITEIQQKLDSSIAAERVWETTMMQVCGEDGPASVAAEIKNLRSLRDTALVTLRSENEKLQRKLEIAMEMADNSLVVLRAETARSNQLAVENSELKSTLEHVINSDNQPEYHDQGMGCGVEDRGYQRDGYAACYYGWESAMERVYSEVIPDSMPATPITDTVIAEIYSRAIESVVPAGFVVVPERIELPAESMEGICFHCGDGGHQFGAFTEGTLFIGEVENDDGSKVYGIHIATADYPEEGCATICEFSQPLRKESAIHEQ